MVILERGADLHMAQLMPLPLTVSCFSKIQIGFTFLVPAHLGGPGKRAVKRACVCVCVCVLDSPHVQPLSRSSLVFPLVLNPQLHAPYISSPSHLPTEQDEMRRTRKHPFNGPLSGTTWPYATLHLAPDRWRQPRRGCRGHTPNILVGGGDVNGNIPPTLLRTFGYSRPILVAHEPQADFIRL